VGQAIRWDSTLTSDAQSASAVSASASPDSEHKTKGRRRRKIPPKRPNISLENQRVWNKPLANGVVPAYDLALKVIATDSQQLKAEVAVLRAEIGEKEAQYKALEEELDALPEEKRSGKKEEMDRLDKAIEEMMMKANVVEIQSEVNIPEVRWNVNNAMGMSVFLVTR
jgi:large subunit ribosomal protein L35